MRIYSLIIFLLCLNNSYAQTAMDAYRISRTNIGGTARFIGTAGSLSALGADFSVASINPAGLTSYRSSSLMMNMELFKASSTTDYLGESLKQNKYNFNINNVGFVNAGPLDEDGNAFTSYTFAIGMNNLNTYDSEYHIEGSSSGAIGEYFANYANLYGVPDADVAIEPVTYAANTGLIYENDGTYFADNYGSSLLDKSQTVETHGYLNEMVISGALNYKEQLSFGLTVGIPFYYYQENKRYIENDLGNTVDVFENLSFGENLQVNATGLNLKLGVLYHKYLSLGKERLKVALGGAIHTPSYFWHTDVYSYDMATTLNIEDVGIETYIDRNGYGEDTEQEYEYKYEMITPTRLIGNIGVSVLKKGFITAEIEYADYSTMEYIFDQEATVENAVNQSIINNFDNSIHFKVGAEVVVGLMRLRGGMATATNPILGESGFDKTYSLGLGAYFDSWFVDLAYINQSQSFFHTPYFDPNNNIQLDSNFPIGVDQRTPSVSVTFGLRIED